MKKKNEGQQSERLHSLDVLRGFDMLWIIGGGSLIAALAKTLDWGWLHAVAGQMEHVSWVGFHFEDLIFPMFMFISGVAIPYAVTSKVEQGADKKPLLYKIIKRGLLLVLLGVFYNGALRHEFTGISDIRIASVLGQIGLEASVEQYIKSLVDVFREVNRALTPNGVLWLNIGDSYTSGGRTSRAPDKKNPARSMSVRPATPAGLKPKDLIGVPWRLAFALQSDGWYLRSDIIWEKPNCMPESVKDRPTRSHEYMFLMSKSEKYYYDHQATREKNRNKRSVWSVNTKPFMAAHFATFPPQLIEPCILTGSRENDFVLDPFFGSGTVGLVCREYQRHCVGIELNPKYVAMSRARLEDAAPVFALPKAA